MVFEGKLAYPGDFEWGAISKTRTRLWSMKQIRLQLPEAQAQQLKATAAELSQRSKDSFMHTVKFLSDGQFSLTVSRMGSMTTNELAFSIQILAGLKPNPRAYRRYPNMPKVARKEREQVNKGPPETSTEWTELQQRVHALPLELFSWIEKLTFDGAFLGDIHPYLGRGGKCCVGDDVNLNALGLIDRSTRQEYADRVWVENLWVIGPDYSLSHLTNTTRHRIKRLHLIFGRPHDRDCNGILEQTWWNVDHTEDDVWRRFMDLDGKRRSQSDDSAYHSLFRWKSEASHLSHLMLQLEELTLDFRAACGLDGSFLGTELVKDFPPFYHGIIPGTFIVEAPTAALADTIRQTIIDINIAVSA